MRTDAAKRGLDPDKWFDNVEVVVARRIGIETTTYVGPWVTSRSRAWGTSLRCP